jgi:hypothetical protein
MQTSYLERAVAIGGFAASLLLVAAIAVGTA